METFNKIFGKTFFLTEESFRGSSDDEQEFIDKETEPLDSETVKDNE